MPAPSGSEQSGDLRLSNGSANMGNNDDRTQVPVMVRPTKKSQKPVWPFMDSWGLYRKAITADGNCLFRALSDQMYNTTDRHNEIRQMVVEHLRMNRQEFEPFVPFNTEETCMRSQPSTRSSRLRRGNTKDDWFEVYLENMAKPKTWGGEIEIRAFCEAFNRDVLIHRPTDAGQPFDQMINSKRDGGQPRHFVHVSFGGEENHPHYESVRPIKASDTAESSAPRLSSTTTGSLCGSTDRALPLCDYGIEELNQIQRTRPSLSGDGLHAFLESSRNHIDTIFAQIINADRERSSSASSASRRSSSSKRSREDDEDPDKASKRALRRISLRSKKSTFAPMTTPTSSLRGKEASSQLRLDSAPSNPAQILNVKGSAGYQQDDLIVGCEIAKEGAATHNDLAPLERVIPQENAPTSAETLSSEKVCR